MIIGLTLSVFGMIPPISSPITSLSSMAEQAVNFRIREVGVHISIRNAEKEVFHPAKHRVGVTNLALFAMMF
jgi:hypothetical protein